ncbi:MAG: hypothetical protein K9K32_00220 [Halanaerobiales bacterium]|nr:hypothetical protein [Halanaerobiales bacterium]
MIDRVPKIIKVKDKPYQLIHKKRFSLWKDDKAIDFLKKKYNANIVLRKKGYIYLLRKIENAKYKTIKENNG